MVHPHIRSGVALIAAAVVAAAPAPVLARRPASATQTLVVERLNAARAAYGAPPLHRDRRLARAARRHTRDMVAHRYFAHESRSGARFSSRIARTGWMRGRARWRVGETLAWGIGRKAAPRMIVAAWLASASHRRVMLQPRFRVIGTGIAAGTPLGDGRSGWTYTADFGS